jgi:hypothetical protein
MKDIEYMNIDVSQITQTFLVQKPKAGAFLRRALGRVRGDSIRWGS